MAEAASSDHQNNVLAHEAHGSPWLAEAIAWREIAVDELNATDDPDAQQAAQDTVRRAMAEVEMRRLLLGFDDKQQDPLPPPVIPKKK